MSTRDSTSGSLITAIMILLLIAVVFLMLRPTPPDVPIPPTLVPTQFQLPTEPIPTSVVPTDAPVFPTFPPQFTPQINAAGDGNSQLRVVVSEGGDVNSIAAVLHSYEWMTGELDLNRATALYLYSDAWTATTYTEDYSFAPNLYMQFLYSGLVAQIRMDSSADSGFCGIRMNATGNSNYIDLLLYRNGFLKTVVVADGIEEVNDRKLVFQDNSQIRTDGRAFATVYMFYDEPGLTIIANYHILGSETPISERIQIDHNRLPIAPEPGQLMLRVGTNYGQTTYCGFDNFYQYPIRHN